MKNAKAPAGQMTLVEHLTELRSRIIKSLVAVAVGTVIAWILYPHIFDLLIHPYRQVIGNNSITGGRLLQTDPLDGLAIRMKMSIYSGIMIAMPVIMWQLWQFVTPALHPHEKRYVVPF